MTKLEKELSKKKITKSNLAKKLGLARATVSINSKIGLKKPKTAQRYALALGCQWIDLLEEDF